MLNMRTYFKEEMLDFDMCRPGYNTTLLFEAWSGCFTKEPMKVIHGSGEVTVEGLSFGDSSTAGGLDVC